MIRKIEEIFLVNSDERPFCTKCKSKEAVQSRFAWALENPKDQFPLLSDWYCKDCDRDFF